MRTRRVDRYILFGYDPEPAPLRVWTYWLKNSRKSRRVAETEIGDIRISTVFLGIDHQFGDGPPLLFESMIFGGAFDHEIDRYSTWDEAKAGHQAMVEKVITSISDRKLLT